MSWKNKIFIHSNYLFFETNFSSYKWVICIVMIFVSTLSSDCFTHYQYPDHKYTNSFGSRVCHNLKWPCHLQIDLTQHRRPEVKQQNTTIHLLGDILLKRCMERDRRMERTLKNWRRDWRERNEKEEEKKSRQGKARQGESWLRRNGEAVTANLKELLNEILCGEAWSSRGLFGT